MPEENDIKEGKIFALMGYLSILCLIPLILKKNNKFALYHAKQGLVLFIAELTIILIGILPFIGWLLSVLGTFLCALISLYGIIECLIGNYAKIPVISYIANKIEL